MTRRDCNVTRSVEYVDNERYLNKVGEYARTLDMSEGSSTELVNKFHAVLHEARVDSLKTRLIEDKPEWLFTFSRKSRFLLPTAGWGQAIGISTSFKSNISFCARNACERQGDHRPRPMTGRYHRPPVSGRLQAACLLFPGVF